MEHCSELSGKKDQNFVEIIMGNTVWLVLLTPVQGKVIRLQVCRHREQGQICAEQSQHTKDRHLLCVSSKA